MGEYPPINIGEPTYFEPGQFTINDDIHTEDTDSPETGASAYTFDNYQEDTGTTAIYPDYGDGTPVSISYVIFGLIGEAGEIANKYKKVIRDQDGALTSDYRAYIIKELGDVLWYSSQLATELNVRLSDIAADNIRKLQDRKQRDKLHGSGDDR